MNIIFTENAPAAIGPYSQAIKANGFVFTSGQIPIDPKSGKIAEGFELQCRQALKNLEAVLYASGSSLNKTIKTTVYLKDMNNFAAFNVIYAEFFKENHPARSCVQVARLPKDVLIEIEAVALY